VNCWWPSLMASDWALWMNPRARSVYFSRFIAVSLGSAPRPEATQNRPDDVGLTALGELCVYLGARPRARKGRGRISRMLPRFVQIILSYNYWPQIGPVAAPSKKRRAKAAAET
jgi:hypothetical protein